MKYRKIDEEKYLGDEREKLTEEGRRPKSFLAGGEGRGGKINFGHWALIRIQQQ